MNFIGSWVFKTKNLNIRFKFAFIMLLAFSLIYHVLNFKSRNIIKIVIDHLKQNENTEISNKIKACIFILVQNSDLDTLRKTMTHFEKQFNEKFNYPYVLMNDQSFTQEFQNEIVKYTNSTIEFGVIPGNCEYVS